MVNDAVKFDIPVLGLSQQPLIFDLNTATISLLMTIPRLGQAEARAVRDHRDQRGGFTRVEELADVPEMTRLAIAKAIEMRGRYLAGAKL